MHSFVWKFSLDGAAMYEVLFVLVVLYACPNDDTEMATFDCTAQLHDNSGLRRQLCQDV